ncbi:dephospho-CoA kinase [Candidatus Termititenax aidoneus]|uniref:Dephospho-CoA kinase n=1 Tax=Termititenax aidoneus TaxID=2218524 RepID=A0A388TAA4_TERA1|nr:dephospho-CoA kinase [Candidatus Termititenax aidoneus]
MIIGVTGIIGSGKSEAARLLARRFAAEHIEVDAVGHQTLAENKFVRCGLRLFFGSTERRDIAAQVFKSPLKLWLLNALTHPFMRRIIRRRIRAPRKHEGIIPRHFVIDAALLYQMGLAKYCDKVLFVDAPENLLYERLTARGLTAGQVWRRLAANQKVYIYKKHAYKVIINDGSLAALQKNIENF